MAEEGEPPPPRAPARPTVAPDAGDAFELWLQQRLHELYDDVIRDPIPPELLRLIQDDRSRRGG